MRKLLALWALLLGTVACSSGGTTTAEPTGTPSVTASTGGEPATEQPLPCVPGAQPFTGPAAEAFGAERVMAAYCMLVEAAEEQEGTTLALPVPDQEIADVREIRALLTPRAGRDWLQLVRDRASGDTAAARRVNGLTLHDVSELPDGYADSTTGPDVYGTQVGPARVEPVRDGAALSLSFTLRTALVLEERGSQTGRHSLLPVTRRATYVLVPDGDGWLIDAWTARFVHDAVRLVSG